MQASEMQKFAGTGGSTILITREPTHDAEKRRDRVSLALFDGAHFNTTHVASEQSEGICRITQRDVDRRDAENSPIYLYDFTFHNVTLISSDEGVLTYTGWLTSVRCYDDGGEPPKDNGSYQWLPPHSRHFAQFLPCKVHITISAKR